MDIDKQAIENEITIIELHAEKIRAMQADIEDDVFNYKFREDESLSNKLCGIQTELSRNVIKNEIILDYAIAIKEQCDKIMDILYPNK